MRKQIHGPHGAPTKAKVYRPVPLGDILKRAKDDSKLAPSVEDLTFINIMEEGFYKDEVNNWAAPLPFKQHRCCRPSNKAQAQ